MAENKTPATPAPQVSQKVVDNFAALIKQAGATQSGNAAKGAVYTQQDADAAVQNIYQQLFGKNAMGADYKNAVNAYINQSQDTQVAGRTQAVINYAQSTPEFQAQQEDKYLDAMYNAVAANVRKARQ